MKNPYLKKELAFVVLILFLGLTFAPSINADTDTLTEDELNNPCYMDIPLRYRHINKDGQIRTVTKTRPDFMAERIQSSEEDLAIISANVEMGNHPPIIIDGNDDFTSENGVTGGSGTENDPYIIEDWIIEGEGANAEGIFIMNTDAYFVIRNCTTNGFYGASPGKWGSGIKLSSVENGRIESSTTHGNQRGICVQKNSAHIEIVNCSCGNYSFNYARGIRCDNSQYISIISSECHDTEYGLFLNDTSYVVIENSSFYNNTWNGIWGIGNYRYSIFNYTIKNCKVYNNAFGIDIHIWDNNALIRHSGNLHISNCEIFDNGIPEPLHSGFMGLAISGLHDNIIENCTIYHNGMGIFLDDSTNNIIRNCSIFNHSFNTGILAPGIQIQDNGFTLGYKMRGSHNEITNCDIFNNEIGIFPCSWSKTFVQKNNIFNNSWVGIIPTYFDRSRINYNNIYGNGFGELSDGSVILAYFCFNDLRHNWWGSSNGPEIGRYKDIYRVFSIAFFRPWATEPIPDAGVQ